MNPKVLIGIFIGAMSAFIFSGITMGAVGRAAGSMVEEVRRQFREIKGILEGIATPDYGRCIQISTKSALREMILPSLFGYSYSCVSRYSSRCFRRSGTFNRWNVHWIYSCYF